MKIRTGFVSNSSTSSFVCDFNSTDKYKRSTILVQEGMDELAALYKKLVPDTNFDKDSYEIIIGDKAYEKKMVKDWGFKDLEGHIIGHAIIIGTQDNSIPGQLFDIIEQAFDAQRWHLG